MNLVLSEHLPLLATAPNGIQKLRGLILGLAVRGKLVPQDPNDEPASALLVRIAQERALLEGVKARKTNDQNPLGKRAPLFELPESWVWVGFGEIARHNAGKTLDRGRNSGHPRDYITTSNLYWGRFELRDLKQMLIGDDEVERCTARKNDLLICEGGEAGRTAVWPYDREVCFQNHVHRARFFGGVDPYFGYYFFEWLNASGEIDQYRKGVGISNMSGKSLSSIPFTLPPLAEQHRIVAKINELMALCDRLEAEQADAESAQAKLVETLLGTLTRSTDAADFTTNWQRLAEHFDTLFTSESSLNALKQTILQLAVMGKLVPQDSSEQPASKLLDQIAQERTGLEAERISKKMKPMPKVREDEQVFEVPNGWEWTRFSAIWLSSFYGPRFGSGEYVTEDGVPTIRTTDMSDGVVRMKNPPMVRLSKTQLAQYTLIKGDILVTRSGSIGTMALYESDAPAIPSAYLIRIRLPKVVSARYVLHFLTAPIGQNLLGLNATSVGVPNVSASKMADFPFPLPPLAEQHRIVAKVDELMALCDRLKADLVESRRRQAALASTLIDSALKAA